MYTEYRCDLDRLSSAIVHAALQQIVISTGLAESYCYNSSTQNSIR